MTHDFKDASFILPEDVKEKWLAALRSGEYKQCGGQLYNGYGYCCLGVLEMVTLGEVDCYPDSGDAMGMPGRISCKLMGVLFRAGHTAPAFSVGESFLAELNDTGTSFLEIADLIERGVGTYKREV